MPCYGMNGGMNYAAGDYYRGDYYRGDYYRGDLFGFFKGLAKKAVGIGTKLIGATPLGAAAGAGLSSLPIFRQHGGGVPRFPPPQVGPFDTTLYAPGVAPPPIAGVVGAEQMPRLRRTHWNKSTYVVRGGGTSRWGPPGQCVVIPKGTQAVPNRRMNVANPKALRRALRRAAGFAKLARRYVKITHHYKTKAKRRRR